MPIKATRFKCTIDEASGSFMLAFIDEGGARDAPTHTRNITLRSWAQVQATVELARIGKLESNSEVTHRAQANRPPVLHAETVEEYLARGGRITREDKRITAPKATDIAAWDSFLEELLFPAEEEGGTDAKVMREIAARF